jgi:hypothetical protein
MSYSKRQFVTAAFEEIGLASYVFDLQPQDLESALRRLDAMMAEWNAKGIRLAYPLPGSPEASDIDAESAVPDSANEAIITNLASRLAPSYGKTLNPMTAITAKNGYNTLLSRAAVPPERQFPSTLPAGAGWKPWRDYNDPYVRPPVDPVQVGPDGPLEFN